MRRLNLGIILSTLTVAILLMPGCKRQPDKVQVEATDEEEQSLLSMVHAADPRASVQFVKGFYDVEQNSWRWTMRKFAVTLRPPAGAAEKGATLELKFAIPDLVMDRLKSMTLTANVEGAPLPPQTYTKSGEQTYTQDVPATALKAEAATVNFDLDKAMEPGTADRRELGVVVSMVGFEAK